MATAWKLLSDIPGCEWVEGYRIGYNVDFPGDNKFVIQSCHERMYVRGKEGAVSVLTSNWHTLKACRGTLRGVKRSGYLQCVVYTGKRRKTVQLHSLGYAAFGSERPSPEHCVLHRNDVKTQNDLDNLYWGLSKQNQQDAIRNGRKFARGSELPQSKITAADAAEIYRRAWEGENRSTIAAEFGISQPNVSMIKTKRSWKHIHDNDGE